ncbi:hypothetical protein ACFOLJ_17160 [Rugamonas sp. CCM 8940]|uniref:DUF7931 domain-containing protein n=1 Tax=Rugamonas sp. CCM 8940 TaxID=2765359 RepID=UPI0018F2BCD9|nr:hypothetical protein [Rugamonas sp. CCM 8940]MBJ7308622.1 hypothetical protein [Rugamonas sp. CCM 8940]
MEQSSQPFSSRTQFEQHLRDCFARAEHRLDLFDPDFSLWQLGHSTVDAELRRFLAGHGRLRLAAHGNEHLQRQEPRFLRLLRDFGHAVECRVTPAGLRQLSDSFCLADGAMLVRRFHCDHLRGVAVFADSDAIKLASDRFESIWSESLPGLHASTAGL